MYAHNFQTAAPNCMKFGMGVVLAVGKVRSMALGSQTFSQERLKLNESKYGGNLATPLTFTIICFNVDA